MGGGIPVPLWSRESVRWLHRITGKLRGVAACSNGAPHQQIEAAAGGARLRHGSAAALYSDEAARRKGGIGS
jgi:hypothetical protein